MACTSSEALDALRRLHPKAIDLGLERLENLLQRLGHPERRLPPVVHVAGTNGKGSTIAFMRAGLEAAGHKVHVYTSPHLVTFHERIRLAGRVIDEPTLTKVLNDVLTANAGDSITFFEATTSAALLAFSRLPADYTLLEVGMGGRLDATNVAGLQPQVCVIAPVSMDHEDFLGSTLGAIAGEKAGILRPNVPAVVGPQDTAALEVIRARAAAVGCPLFVFGDDWHVKTESSQLIFRGKGLLAAELRLPLPRSLRGPHQVENAGAALAVLQLLGRRDRSSLESVVLHAEWPGRLQRLTAGTLVDEVAGRAELWLDGGHNPAAGVALAKALQELQEGSAEEGGLQESQQAVPAYQVHLPSELHSKAPPAAKRQNVAADPVSGDGHGHGTIFICGMLRSKDVRGFLAPLRSCGDSLYAVPIPSEGALALRAEETAAAAKAVGFDAHVVGSPLEAVRAVLSNASIARPGAAVALRMVICGSLYLAGSVLRDNGSQTVATSGASSGSGEARQTSRL